jgi:hypothetical protein
MESSTASSTTGAAKLQPLQIAATAVAVSRYEGVRVAAAVAVAAVLLSPEQVQ